jgi:hypothetical protein
MIGCAAGCGGRASAAGQACSKPKCARRLAARMESADDCPADQMPTQRDSKQRKATGASFNRDAVVKIGLFGKAKRIK